MRRRLPRIRSSNWFVIIVIAIAFVAVMGALLAYYLLVEKVDVQLAPPPPPPPPAPVEPFRPMPVEAWDEAEEEREPAPRPARARKKAKRRVESLTDPSIQATLSRLSGQFDRCARDHGGVDGSIVRVGFSVGPQGRATEAFSLSPHERTPLGRCIVNVVAGARFGRSELGRSEIRWSIRLNP